MTNISRLSIDNVNLFDQGIGDGGVFADTELGVAAKFRWSRTESPGDLTPPAPWRRF